MPTRNYSSIAKPVLLLADIDAVTTAVTFSYPALQGWPSVPCLAVIERGSPSEELVLITAGVDDGTTGTWTVTRGVDSTPAVPHSAGAKIEHVTAAVDFREAQSRLDAIEAEPMYLGSLTGLLSTALPVDYLSFGVSVGHVVTADGWPLTGTLHSFMSASTSRVTQYLTAYNTAQTFQRSYHTGNANGWSDWEEVVHFGDVHMGNIPSKIAQRDTSGDLVARLFRSEYPSNNGQIAAIMTQRAMGGAGTDNYIRPTAPETFKSALGIPKTLSKTGLSDNFAWTFSSAFASVPVIALGLYVSNTQNNLYTSWFSSKSTTAVTPQYYAISGAYVDAIAMEATD